MGNLVGVWLLAAALSAWAPFSFAAGGSGTVESYNYGPATFAITSLDNASVCAAAQAFEEAHVSGGLSGGSWSQTSCTASLSTVGDSFSAGWHVTGCGICDTNVSDSFTLTAWTPEEEEEEEDTMFTPAMAQQWLALIGLVVCFGLGFIGGQQR